MSSVSFSALGNNGRLSNSLFQISALISYCNKHGKTPVIPDWKYLEYFPNLPKPTANIPIDRVYNEPAFEYNEIPNFSHPFDMNGYFQSAKYHEGIDIQNLFKLPEHVEDYLSQTFQMKNPLKKKTCSIHIRRGDYLIEPHLSYHGVLPLSYYSNAISALYGEKYEDVLFFVFSDDIPYCKEHITLENVCFIEGLKDIGDLFLMSMCDDNIIANSSFSWWASYLNKNPFKKIVAPKQWFAGANLNTRDLYLPNSIIL